MLGIDYVKSAHSTSMTCSSSPQHAHMRARLLCGLASLLAVLGASSAATAQPGDTADIWHTTSHVGDVALLAQTPTSSAEEATADDNEQADETKDAKADAGDEDAKADESPKKTTVDNGEKPWTEAPDKSYRFIGLRTRLVVIPKFMFSLYQADGGATVTSPSIGPEFISRRNDFEYAVWLTYASFGMDNVPFKAKSDPDVAYELVTSNLKVITLGTDFLWSLPIDHGISFVYGGGAGLGAVFGDLHRNQAYPRSGVPGDPDNYVKCSGPGDGPGGYCGNDNDHYGNYTEPSWLSGGSKPVIFPWIALPQIGLRWKPSKSFVLRLDTGLSFPGPFFFGLSGAYGLPS